MKVSKKRRTITSDPDKDKIRLNSTEEDCSPPEFRYDPLENIWVIVAAERNKRPLPQREKLIKDSSEGCPFCVGHESDTPPEIWRLPAEEIGKNSSTWKIRVIPNKYPALKKSLTGRRFEHGLYESIEGTGDHEVIIETPEHDITFEEIPQQHIEEVLRTYRTRIETLYRNPGIKYALLFKNQGVKAGASLRHPHSQLIGTPVLPKGVASKLESSFRYYKKTSRCLICDLIKQEKAEDSRWVFSKKGITAFVPYAARFPYEIFIVPEKHCSCFTQANDEILTAVSEVLKEMLLRLKKLLEEAPYNLILNTAPNTRFKMKAWPGKKEKQFFQEPGDKNYDYYHWHINIFPRLNPIAAFEWSSGFSINPVPPEVSAKALRKKL